MIQSINLSNSYTVPFGPGSALIKCRLIIVTQMGVRGTYSRAVPPFASIFEELFWYLKHEWKLGKFNRKSVLVLSWPALCFPNLLVLSAELEDLNPKRRTSVIVCVCSEIPAKRFHQKGFEMGISLFGMQWNRQPG